MNVPKQTGEIFELLSKGQFICSNSSDSRISKLSEILDDPENIMNTLYEYFYSDQFSFLKRETNIITSHEGTNQKRT